MTAMNTTIVTTQKKLQELECLRRVELETNLNMLGHTKPPKELASK